MNIITSLLDIEDNDFELLSCEVQGLKKIVTFGSVSTPPILSEVLLQNAFSRDQN